jgi:hypothetical protein
MIDRIGDWMQTRSGVAFHPFDPRPEEIVFEDIAHALSKICRYGGQCLTYYSVAEHSVHVASMAPDALKLTALMHDASEAYLADIIGPIKRCLKEYRAAEATLEHMIAEKFRLFYPYPDEIKQLDKRIIEDERQQNMSPPPMAWGGHREPLGVTLRFWPPQLAYTQFRAAFHAYGGTS